MKLVEAKLRIGLQKVAAKDDAPHTATPDRPGPSSPDWRLLKVNA
jgi:hypothetical protein